MKYRLLLFFLATSLSLLAQKDIRLAQGLSPANRLSPLSMPSLDNEALLEAEMARRGPDIAPHFAESIDVDISPASHGHWETASNGNQVWRLRIQSSGAKSLNLGFSQYQLPEGASLVLYTPDYKNIIGPFTPADNEEHAQLWTPVLAGDELVIEVQVPTASRNHLDLNLSTINHDFLGFGVAASGSCNIDVICGMVDGWSQVDGYRDIIRSVAVISTGGNTFCTGFLINNTRQDCTPFFITANHCGISANNAASLVTYWNFENTYCREVGSPDSGAGGDGTLNDFNTGAIFRSSSSPTDFTLVELDDPVSETADAFFAGWNRAEVAPTSTIAVHHPNTDEKRISFENDPSILTTNGGNSTVNNFTHIRVADWDAGTTEGGSSGSPLFDQNKYVVGQLHGGQAACGNNLSDWYGSLAISWEGGGSSNSRLKDWLDPDNSGVMTLEGREAAACSYSVEVNTPFLQSCAPAMSSISVTVSDAFDSMVNLSWTSTLPEASGSISLTQSQVAPGGSTSLDLNLNANANTGDYTITVTATDGTNTANIEIQINVFESIPSIATLQMPSNNAFGVSTIPNFTWVTDSEGNTHELQIAADPNFTTIITTITDLSGSNYLGYSLTPLTTYYWRIQANNLCGLADWSEIYSFTTADISCNLDANNNPVAISIDDAIIITSEINITEEGFIDDLDLTDLNISHTWVGDLIITLESPSGTVVTLMDRPGIPGSDFGCGNDNLLLNFDDEAGVNYDVLENSCANGAPYAIEGSFEPLNALSAFNGESATGTWILSVNDTEDGDGGALEGWNLMICSTVIPDYSISPSNELISACPGDNPSFNIVLGEDFAATGVTLSLVDGPSGMTVDFSPNPALPGATVLATVNGNLTAGILTLGANDGAISGETEVVLNLNSVPSAAILSAPANGMTEQDINTTLSWQSVNDATSYQVMVATDVNFMDMIVDVTQAGTSYSVPGLSPGTTYYWRVNASNDCGGNFSEVYSFTVSADVSFGINPANQTSCLGANLSFALQIGTGFNPNGTVLSYTIDPPQPFNLEFDADDLNNIIPGSLVTASLDAIGNPGVYTLTFTLNDGTHLETTAAQLTLLGPAMATSLQSPANANTGIALLPSFSWSSVDNAVDYQFRIATDDGFNNIIETIDLNVTDYTLSNSLESGTIYFWQVVSNNDCGNTNSPVFSFTTEVIDQVEELNQSKVDIIPNPSQGMVQITFSEILPGTVQFDLYSVNGQLLQQKQSQGQSEVILNLQEYPDGIYLLRLINDNQVMTQKLILQR